MYDISELKRCISDLYEKHRGNNQGDVASYIPELGKADPDLFGISLVTVDGQEFSVGDYQHEFTIQSIIKPIAFLLALEMHGRDKTLAHVGVEPSGDAFNSVELNPRTRLPYNPMVNAGDISVASLIKGASPEAGVSALLDRLGIAAGRDLRIDEHVRDSEATTGSRNRAIAYLLHNFGVIDDGIDHTLHQYFSQCSVLVNCRDLAMIAATIANIGENPATGREAFALTYVRDAMAAMFSCGMYDYSGEWAYRVGVPAKSGVAGGLMAVINRQLGIAVFSPRLDERGNSVRGIAVCTDLAEEFGLHAFEFMNPGSNFLRDAPPTEAAG